MTVLNVCEWLQSLPLASGVKHSAWQFPLVESVHSLALAVMLWPAAILDLRLLGAIMKRRPGFRGRRAVPAMGVDRLHNDGSERLDSVRFRSRQMLRQPVLPRESRVAGGCGIERPGFPHDGLSRRRGLGQRSPYALASKTGGSIFAPGLDWCRGDGTGSGLCLAHPSSLSSIGAARHGWAPS